MDKPQHIRYNEKPHMAPPYVHLVQMADSTVARGNSDIFELNVHIVFGCARGGSQSTVSSVGRTTEMCPETETLRRPRRTFNELASVYLAGCNLERDNMVLGHGGCQPHNPRIEGRR